MKRVTPSSALRTIWIALLFASCSSDGNGVGEDSTGDGDTTASTMTTTDSPTSTTNGSTTRMDTTDTGSDTTADEGSTSEESGDSTRGSDESETGDVGTTTDTGEGSTGSDGTTTGETGGTTGETTGETGTTETTGSGLVSYENDAQPIFQKYCSACHGGSSFGGHNIATTYSDALLDAVHASCDGLNKGQCTIVLIKAGVMPNGAGCTGDPDLDSANASCLTAAEQQVIQDWIDDGLQP